MNKKILVLAISTLLFSGTAQAQTSQCPGIGWTWNGSNCQVNQQSCTAAGGTWNGLNCTSGSGSQTTQPQTPTMTPQQGCAQYGGIWNGSTCQMPNQSVPTQPVPASSQPQPSQPVTLPPLPLPDATATAAFRQGLDDQTKALDLQQKILDRQDNLTQRSQQQMINQAKASGKQIQNTLASIAKLQVRLQKSGLSVSTDCLQTMSDSADTASSLAAGETDFDPQDISDTIQSIEACRAEASNLIQTPTLYKAIERAVAKFKKKNPDQDITADVNAFENDYATLKTSSFGDDQIISFFQDAQDLSDTVGLKIPTNLMPSDQQIQNMQNNQSQSNSNQGAVVQKAVQNISNFFKRLFKK